MGVTEGSVPTVGVPPPRPWVVLLVDDEPDLLVSLKDLVEASLPGTRVIGVPTGRAALEALDRERIDLIISDFRMPGMDGIEFLYQARRRHPGVPRIMLTAFADEGLARRAISEVFVDEFISKAARPKDFLERVLRRLEYSPLPARPAAAPP